jgi:hypothetical protein
MIFGACAREKEVAELLLRGHWPHACSAELRAHVAACRACSDLVLVTQSFRSAHAGAAGVARLEAPGVLWWRAQLRRRNAAIERIGKPILGAQIFALAMTLLAAAGLVISQARQGFRWMSWFDELPRLLHLATLWLATLPNFDGRFWLLVPVLATLALVSGVVVYLASEKR